MNEYLGEEKVLIDKVTKEEIMKGFISEKDFMDFHELEDETNYLEIKEEAEKRREKRAEQIIERYCGERGIIDKGQLGNYDEIILRLLEETGLSYRKIAEITGVSLNAIYNANKKNRT
ncbi:MAG: hypothetical protein VR72_00300 [Clostridiaceae bacterium BRH_c20a]|nr:MAG: hypothetical protein VR72_00300 [Clostridiaceae bacterium BRH_c20a]